MLDGFSSGTKLDGFCNGYFGRDSYGEKTIVASGTWNGEHYIVAKDEGCTQLSFASGFSMQDAKEWLSGDNEPDWEGM